MRFKRRAPLPPPNNGAPSPRRAFLTLFPSIMLPMFLAMADQTIVAAAIPAIAGDLGDVDQVSWIVVSYLVATTVAAPVYGRLGDLLGRRRLMTYALAIFIGASILCAASASIVMLTAARALQGLGGGGLMTLSQALIGETVPPRERGRYQGFLATTAVASSAFGAVAGGLLTQHFGWRAIFVVSVPIGIVALLLVQRLPAAGAGSGERFRFDLPGLLFFGVFIVSALIMLHQVQQLAPNAPLAVPILSAAGFASLVLLIWWERRASLPLLPPQVLRDPTIWRCDALAACQGAMLVSLITFLPIELRVVHGADAGEIGVLLLPIAGGVALGSIITGWLVTRTGRTAIFPSVGLIFVVTILATVAVLSPRLSAGQLSASLGVAALFMGTVMSVVQITVQSAAGRAMLGTAAASVQFSRSLGAALGTAAVGTVLFSTVAMTDADAAGLLEEIVRSGPAVLDRYPETRQAVIRSEIAQGFRAAFLAIAAFGTISAALSWTIPLRRV